MDKIKIVGVPEHFNFPWTETVEEQPFKGEGILLEWSDEPRGSGAMNQSIRDGQADMAVVLTESFIKDKVAGNPGKIIGYHVQSPLVWGIHVSSKFPYKGEKDLINLPFLISRKGSGSHLMAFLLARKNNWDPGQLKFEVVGDLHGAKKAMEGPDPKIFLWEKYTTMPLVKQGLFNRPGEIPSPWPAFVIVASPKAIDKFSQQLMKIRDRLYLKSDDLPNIPDFPQRLSRLYGIDLEDIKEWLSQTRWAINGEIKKSEMEEAIETLKSLNLLSREIAVQELVDQDFVKLV